MRVALYPQADKIGRQFKFADRSGLRFVIVAGPEERDQNALQVKDLKDGSQTRLDLADVEKELQALLSTA